MAEASEGQKDLYAVPFIDEATRFAVVCTLSTKDHAAQALEKYLGEYVTPVDSKVFTIL